MQLKNFFNGFLKQSSIKREILHKILNGLPVKLKGFSKKSIKRTSIWRKM